jgi:hypothetical protein
MASEHSYKITLSNNKTEKRGIDLLLESDSQFLLPTKEGRKQIMEVLNIDKKYSRAFDLFILPGHTNSEKEITLEQADDIILVELKTTEKYLPDLPKGFFFGATQNEFDLAEQMKDRYKFCFVSLHPDSQKFELLTVKELDKIVINKRVQFQINL